MEGGKEGYIDGGREGGEGERRWGGSQYLFSIRLDTPDKVRVCFLKPLYQGDERLLKLCAHSLGRAMPHGRGP